MTGVGPQRFQGHRRIDEPPSNELAQPLMLWIMLIVQYGLGFHAKQVPAAAVADASTRPQSAPRQPTASGPARSFRP